MSRKISAPKQQIIKKHDGDNIPEDFDFPSIGIEDIDRGLFDLFMTFMLSKLTVETFFLLLP